MGTMTVFGPISGPDRIAIDLLGDAWAGAQVSDLGIAYVDLPVDRVGGMLATGQILIAVDPGNDVITEAAVMLIDLQAGHVRLAVDRNGIREDPDVPGDPGCE